MVDQVGWKATAATTRSVSAPVATAKSTAASTAPIRASAAAPVADSAQAGGLAQELAASPPVDGERVARIKAAIAAGKFPILPSTIADRLLALKLEWNGNESGGR